MDCSGLVVAEIRQISGTLQEIQQSSAERLVFGVEHWFEQDRIGLGLLGFC